MTASGSVPAGTRVGRYEIEAFIRGGGMGEVYAAHDANLGRRVALKILPKNRTSDPERVARFVREARSSSTLNHPSIVSVHDAGSDGDMHFLAMELIDGEPLSDWMRKRHGRAARVELMRGERPFCFRQPMKVRIVSPIRRGSPRCSMAATRVSGKLTMLTRSV